MVLSGCLSSRTDKAERDIQALVAAMHAYRLDVGVYPERNQGLQALLARPPGVRNWKGPYVGKPKDLIDPWGNPYQYIIPSRWGAPFDILTVDPTDPTGPLIRAWRLGDTEVQINLGLRFANGRNVAQDYAEAVYWWRMAAEQGNARAQSILGFSYEKGRGVSQDATEAVRWYRLAAEQSHESARQALIRLGVD